MSTMEIKWKNFREQQTDAYYNLLVEKKFTDCVLSAENEFMSVHKIILAAASSYFSDLFTLSGSRGDQQVIVLHGLSYSDLSNVIQFIYTGSIELPLEDLSSFVTIAKSLKIKGIEDFAVNLKVEKENESKNLHEDTNNLSNRKRCLSSIDLSTAGSSTSFYSPKLSLQGSSTKFYSPKLSLPGRLSKIPKRSLPTTTVSDVSPTASFIFVNAITPPASPHKRRSQSLGLEDELNNSEVVLNCKFCPCQYSSYQVRKDHQAVCWFNPDRRASSDQNYSKSLSADNTKKLKNMRLSTFIPF